MIVVHEDIRLALGEREHHSVKRALGHLPVTDHEACVGQHPAELLGLRLDRLDPVVHVEHLAASIELAQDGVPDKPGGRLGDARLDRQAILGRRLDERQVAYSRERQVERARDRRRRQRHDVDLAAHPLEALLGRDTEPLLLVDHDQTEVAEPDVPAEQPVRPDDDVDRAVAEAGERGRLILRRDEPGQEADFEREGGEPLAERPMVLGGEDRRRDQDRDLLAILGGLERGPQRDLGLAVAHVADDQPVHRPHAFHVLLGFGHGAQLVDGLLVRERGLQLGLPWRILRRRGPATGSAPRTARAAPSRGP